jgi:hypothetical protein
MYPGFCRIPFFYFGVGSDTGIYTYSKRVGMRWRQVSSWYHCERMRQGWDLENFTFASFTSVYLGWGSRLIIVALQVEAVKIYVASVEALKQKERQGETQFTTKTEVPSPLNIMYCNLFWNSTYLWSNSGF